jgi:hypothetical protein
MKKRPPAGGAGVGRKGTTTHSSANQPETQDIRADFAKRRYADAIERADAETAERMRRLADDILNGGGL